MALADDIKAMLGITGSTRNAEIEMLIGAALADMARVGLPSDDLQRESLGPMHKHAVACYCKGHFGMDNPEREDFDACYRRIVCGLINSNFEDDEEEEEDDE